MLSVGFAIIQDGDQERWDIKVLMGLKMFAVLGLVEIFLKKEEEVRVTAYEWYGRNRDGGKQASGVVGMLW